MSTLAERFAAKVDRSGEHHVWTGSKKTDGSGKMKVEGRTVLARRVAWELAHGPLPPEAEVRSCPADKACVRVDHLSAPADSCSAHLRAEGAAGAAAPEPRRQRRRSPKGSGSLRQVGANTWDFRVIVRGNPVYRTIRATDATDATDAEKQRAAVVAEHADAWALAADAKDLTVHDLVVGSLEAKAAKGRAHSTLTRYRDVHDNWVHDAVCATRARRLRPEQVDAVFAAMRTANQQRSSMNHAKVVLNGAYKWALRQRPRLVGWNPVEEVELPESLAPSREVVPPDTDEVRRLIAAAFDAIDFDFGVVLQTGAAGGLRRGELAGLTRKVPFDVGPARAGQPAVDLDRAQLFVWQTVNDAGGTVVVQPYTKNKRPRWVSVDDVTIALVAQLMDRQEERAALCGAGLAPNPFLFSTAVDCSTPMRPEYMTRQVRNLRRHLGLANAEFDVTLQALRHWTQTTTNLAGFAPKLLATRGGHTERVMQRVYVHAKRGSDTGVAAFLGDLLRRPDDRTKEGPDRNAATDERSGGRASEDDQPSSGGTRGRRPAAPAGPGPSPEP